MNERSFIVNTHSCSPPRSSVVPHLRNGLKAPPAPGRGALPRESSGEGRRSPPTLLLTGRQIALLFKISYPPLLPSDATQPAQVGPTSRRQRKDPESVAR